MLWPVKGLFGIHDPFDLLRRYKVSLERFALFKIGVLAIEAQLTVAVCFTQLLQKQSAEQTRQYSDR